MRRGYSNQTAALQAQRVDGHGRIPLIWQCGHVGVQLSYVAKRRGIGIMELGIRELKAHLSRHRKRVRRRLTVTERGRAVRDRSSRAVLTSSWRQDGCRGPSPLGRGRSAASRVRGRHAPVSDAVIEDRGDGYLDKQFGELYGRARQRRRPCARRTRVGCRHCVIGYGSSRGPLQAPARTRAQCQRLCLSQEGFEADWPGYDR